VRPDALHDARIRAMHCDLGKAVGVRPDVVHDLRIKARVRPDALHDWRIKARPWLTDD
jgi:hypothetical protein